MEYHILVTLPFLLFLLGLNNIVSLSLDSHSVGLAILAWHQLEEQLLARAQRPAELRLRVLGNRMYEYAMSI